MMIQRYLETELAEYVAASGSFTQEANVYTGLGNEIKAAPAIIVSALSDTEVIPGKAIWRVTVRVKVKSHFFEDTTEGFTTLAKETAETLDTISLDAVLTENIFILDINKSSEDSGQEDKCWTETMTYEFVVTGA